jgi:integrase
MPLKVVKRGQVYHVQGTVRVGSHSVRIRESAGVRDRDAAEAYRLKRENEITDDLLHGKKARAKRIKFSEAVEAYIKRPGDMSEHTTGIVLRLLDHFRDTLLSEIDGSAWKEYLLKRLPGRSGGTANRHRSIFKAIHNNAAAIWGVETVKIKREKESPDRVRYLTTEEQEALLETYPQPARDLATVLCFQGCRLAEAMRIEARDINLNAGTITFPKTKNGTQRIVGIHPRVRSVIDARGAFKGRLLLTTYGEPWKERGGGFQHQHWKACEKVGIDDFRAHDWRHHFASHFIMNGGDLLSLMKVAGWKTMSMVLRYAHLSPLHVREAVGKFGPVSGNAAPPKAEAIDSKLTQRLLADLRKRGKSVH